MSSRRFETRQVSSRRFALTPLRLVWLGLALLGAAVALVCSMNGLPFLVARTISDMADGNAVANFEEILPRASHNSLAFVRHMLAGLAAQA